jgi:hypothetical protein
VEWLFRRTAPDEVERDVTQRSQFDTDETRIEATLIRESHQNSLDARESGSGAAVKTRITFITPAANEKYFNQLFNGLAEHLEVSGIDLTDIDFGKPTFLLIEDFGTTGLVGAWDTKDKRAFSDFWRREGRSHKSGAANGRWGLGKLVFSSSSKIRTFFGLTIRYDDPAQPLLMGEAVLMTHDIEGETCAPYGFYANKGVKGIQIPETDKPAIAEFASATGLTRADQPGFSVVIPFPIDQLKPKSLIEGVITNYFYPILTGELEVEVQGECINAATFDAVAGKYATGKILNPQLIDFIRNIHAAREKQPDFELPANWAQNIESAIGPEKLHELRTAFGTLGSFVHVRAPIVLKKKDNVSHTTFFDLFLCRAPEGVTGDSLYIRSTITVPQEGRNFPATDTFGALLAKDDQIASFLGDAENPAHTQWSLTAEKLKENWKAGPARLTEIRSSLRNLYKALAQLEERTEPDALIDFFSVEDTQPGKKAVPKVAVKPPMPDLPPAEKVYRIARRSGGFAVRPGKGLVKDLLPLRLKVQVAYDVFKGNPLKKFDPLDFHIEHSPIKIAINGASCTYPFPNRMDIEVTDTNFSVEVEGFDQNRDLFIDARKDSK